MDNINFNQIKTWRRDLHKIAELSLQEYKTKEYIKNELNIRNIKYDEVLDTGLIVVLNGNNDNNDAILFRADIDALPILEENKIDFASENPGVMHACGHDGHTTMLLATLVETHQLYVDNKLNITTIFVFQPSEERYGGGNMIVKEYDFSEYNILASYALHLNPDFNENIIVSKPYEIMANATDFKIHIEGMASHAGLKHEGIDTLNVATLLYQELLKIPSMYLDSKNRNIIHIGKLAGGVAPNVIADESCIEGTIRTYNEGDYKIITTFLTKLCRGLESIYNVNIKLEYLYGYPAVINDYELFELTKEATANASIEFKELENAYLFGEDFSFFNQISPINFSFLGIRNEKLGYTSGLHTPTFNFDEKILETGIKYYLSVLNIYNILLNK